MMIVTMNVSDQEFDQIISEVMDELPQEYIERLNNVVITYEDDPSPQQRKELGLRCNQTLFGLYQGIPLTKRPSATSMLSGNPMVMPDKITLFKNPILRHANGDMKEFRAQTKHTLWHEIAHYFGLDHDRIHAIEHGEV